MSVLSDLPIQSAPGEGVFIKQFVSDLDYSTDPPVSQRKQIIWSVPTGRGAVFMRADRGIGRNPDANLDASIVVVDATAFYNLWQKTKGRPWGFPNMPPAREELRVYLGNKHDLDWKDSDRRPVLIPYVGLSEMEKLIFSDGRHRVLWLLRHNAAAFPVMVRDASEAAVLHANVGTREPAKTIRGLIV